MLQRSNNALAARAGGSRTGVDTIMVASSNLTEFLKDPKAIAGTFLTRNHVAIWFIVASELLTAFQMREGAAALIVLAINAFILWLAVTFLKTRQLAIWFAVASEIMTATQMAPDKASVIVLLVNAGLLALAVMAARITATAKEAA
jgi:hypothetical protein